MMKTLTHFLTTTAFFSLIAVSFLRKTPQDTSGINQLSSSQITIDTVATGLNVPWEMIWGHDNFLWITEQSGTISRINPQTGKKYELIRIKEVYRNRSLGLLGMALHPDFTKNPYIYVDYTSRRDSATIVCKLVRFTFQNNRLKSPTLLLELPASTGHNGSRIVISPDRKLIFATGDAASLTYAQDINSLNGKVLRLNLDGSVPSDNPIRGSFVWSLGHRNVQGLTYGTSDILYASEHGDAIEDELNIIEKGKNYGWIRVEGFCDQPGEKSFCDSINVAEPIKAWTPTIAPAGMVFYNNASIPEWKNSVLLTTLKESDLRVVKMDQSGTKVVSEDTYFDNKFGRLRSVCQAPNGDIYLATSNRDWNPGKGFPKPADDMILRIRKTKTGTPLSTYRRPDPVLYTSDAERSGKEIYKLYCASCHKENGQGVAGTFPPLQNAEQVAGPKKDFLQILLKGLKGEIVVLGQKYDQHMPEFAFLKDQQITDVANYVRQNFGKNIERIETSDVASARSGE